MIKTHTINALTAEAQLQAAFHITDHDISENRWGRLSRRQKRRLASEEALLSGILLGFILALSWPLRQVNLQAETWHSDPGIVIWLLLLIVLLCMVIW